MRQQAPDVETWQVQALQQLAMHPSACRARFRFAAPPWRTKQFMAVFQWTTNSHKDFGEFIWRSQFRAPFEWFPSKQEVSF